MAWGRKKPAADKPRWNQDDYHQEFAATLKAQIAQGVAPWQKPCPPCLVRPTVVGAVCQRCHVAAETSSSAPVVTVDGKGLTTSP